MGIKEMKEKKKELESHLTRLVGEFEKSTSLIVESININHVLRDIKIKAFLE